MKAKQLPPLKYLNECFEIDYSSISGLKWKVRPINHFSNERYCNKFNKQFTGKRAGCKINGYYFVDIAFNGVSLAYPVHRIIYAISKGIQDFGDKIIDHIDRDRANNNIDNLRLIELKYNSFNLTLAKNNTSGFTGVSWNKKRKKWKASIMKGGKDICLGFCDNIEDAAKIRELHEKERALVLETQKPTPISQGG